MKTTIKVAALLLIASAGIFAATPSKAAVVPASDVITFSELPADRGIDVKIDPSVQGKSIVMIYDADGNVLRKDVLTKSNGLEKAYILNQLEDGDYTIAVTSNGETVKKAIHVYEEVSAKQFIVLQ